MSVRTVVWSATVLAVVLVGVAVVAPLPGRTTAHALRRPFPRRGDAWAPYLAPESTCPGENDVAAAADAQERTMLCLVNWARARAHLSQLATSPVLMSSAHAKAEDIRRCRDFAHAACGRDPRAVFDDAGYTRPDVTYGYGENLAWASDEIASPVRILDDWLNSPHHRDNVFRGDWTEQGIAMLPARDFLGAASAEIWVSHFGYRR